MLAVPALALAVYAFTGFSPDVRAWMQLQGAFVRVQDFHSDHLPDGDVLVATAREISRSGRSGIYDVRVTVGDIVIAEFRGHCRTVPGTWLPVTEPDKK